jgi:L-ascorbate metabolism protein UlaG (beta-lactamase superfamily)
MVGHATTLIQTQGINILADPMWSDRASPFSWIGPKRAIMPGIKFEDLPKIDLVIISHNHYDHMDEATIKRLVEKHNPLFVTPLGNDVLLKRMDPKIKVITLDWYQNNKIDGDIKIWCYPAQHWSSRWFIDRNKALWGAFIVETKAGNIYFGADTGYGTGWHFEAAVKHFKEFKLAIIPIGAYEPRWFMSYGHIDPFEAIKAMKHLNANHAIAIQFDVFPMAGEEFAAAPKALKQALANEPDLDFKVLDVGKSAFFD